MKRGNYAEHALRAISRNWVIESSSAHTIPSRKINLVTNPSKLISFVLIYSAYRIAEGRNNRTPEEVLGKLLRKWPSNIYLIRALNKENPHKLKGIAAKPRERSTVRTATIITGELRCLNQNWDAVRSICDNTDAFIVTTTEYLKHAKELKTKGVADINDKRVYRTKEKNAIHPAIKQWIKYSRACEMLREEEIREGKEYDLVIKIRTDYHFADVTKLINPRNYQRLQPKQLTGASDKVFGGDRETMMQLDELEKEAKNYYDNWDLLNRDIRISQIIESDESIKWYGLNFSEAIIKKEASTNQITRKLKQMKRKGIDILTSSYFSKQNQPVFKGDSVFPAEIVFAKFLNKRNISMRSSAGMRGVLLNNRKDKQVSVKTFET